MMPDPEKHKRGFVYGPAPYKESITVRSPERAVLVVKEWQEAQKLLDLETKEWKEVPEGMRTM